MENEKLTQNAKVIHQLMEGGPLTSKEIASKVSSGNGTEMDVREVSTIMNKLNKTDLGHFIRKKRKGRAFEYQIVDAAKYLTPEEAYGLSLKIGKDRYPLQQALEDHPDLKKHVKGAKKKDVSTKTRGKASARRAKRVQKTDPQDQPVKPTTDRDADSMAGAWGGLLKKVAGEKDLNVRIDVTIRFEKE